MPHSEQCRQLVYYLGQLTQHKFILMQDHKNLSNKKTQTKYAYKRILEKNGNYF